MHGRGLSWRVWLSPRPLSPSPRILPLRGRGWVVRCSGVFSAIIVGVFAAIVPGDEAEEGGGGFAARLERGRFVEHHRAEVGDGDGEVRAGEVEGAGGVDARDAGARFGDGGIGEPGVEEAGGGAVLGVELLVGDARAEVGGEEVTEARHVGGGRGERREVAGRLADFRRLARRAIGWLVVPRSVHGGIMRRG